MPLDDRIRKHWEKYRPKTVGRLKASGRLEQAIAEAAEQHAETFSEMMSKGFGVDQADEVAREPRITLESQSSKEAET